MAVSELQDFLRSHEDWEDLLSKEPYSLKIKRSSFDDGRYVMFNYDMINSNNYEKIVSEARGIVFDSKDWSIVRRGFDRFFNIGEGPAAKIDWSSANATIKEDGTLIFVSYYGNQYHVGSRQNFDLSDASIGDRSLFPQTFEKLWVDTLDKYYLDFSKMFPSVLNKDYTYCFELCSRFNRIVIDYEQPKIFLLTARNNITGEELSFEKIRNLASVYHVDTPAFYSMSSQEDYEKLVGSFGIEHEGIVVRDANDQRLKMKTKLYFDLHKSVSNGAMTEEAMVNLVRSGEDAEFLSYFPEYLTKFEEVKKQVKEAYVRIQVIKGVTNQERKLSRKEFAMIHKDERDAMLWFKALENKLTDDYIASITDEKFIQLFFDKK